MQCHFKFQMVNRSTLPGEREHSLDESSAILTLPKRRRLIIRRAAIATSSLIVVGLAVSWFVAGALVAPSPCLIGDPPRELMATAFNVDSESGSTIYGWHTHPNTSNGVIVLLHGIRGSRLSMLDRARMLHAAGYATVMIDLQAHGESTGDVITVGHLEQHDVRAAVEFARSEHPNEPIGVLGVSLGGAAALLLCCSACVPLGHRRSRSRISLSEYSRRNPQSGRRCTWSVFINSSVATSSTTPTATWCLASRALPDRTHS